MPTYEYACSSCKNEWEFEQSIKDNALTECPKCHQQTARRQISRGGGFILKGGGWYSDLYSSSSNKPVEGKGADSKSTTASTPSTSTESSGSSSGSSSSSESSGSSSSSGESAAPAKSGPSSPAT
jgi:putative FmdB family regulatory protein